MPRTARLAKLASNVLAPPRRRPRPHQHRRSTPGSVCRIRRRHPGNRARPRRRLGATAQPFAVSTPW
ncbi:hypothetical protein I553_10022 [Mycobacterium xenopi 4042]|uniref:Uncharacterized protein n=1 Tax=Mycobacterium xenopi 4042 TaxID=1299334 RepID=X7YRC8_MYCXE|nr:hypothetical protein I553_10022 [Mycobacterium xenopi 4042]